MDFSSTRFAWIDSLSFSKFMLFFSVAILSRGGIDCVDNYLQRMAMEGFRLRHRQRLVNWLFHSASLNQSAFFNLWDAQTYLSVSTLEYIFQALRQTLVGTMLFAVLVYLSWTVTIPLLLCLALTTLPLRMISKKSRERGEGHHRVTYELQSRLTMSAKNLLLLRIHGMGSREEETIQGKLALCDSIARKHGFLSSLVGSYIYILGTVFMLVLTYMEKKGGLSSATYLMPYLYLLNRFLGMALSIFSLWPSIRFGIPTLVDSASWWANHADDGIRGLALYRKNAQNDFATISEPLGWQMENVTFRYPGQPQPLFENWNLRIAPGTCVAFVGESGSGKSSLISLFIGEIEPQSGSVFVTHDKQKRPLSECRSQILSQLGYVGGESFLIGGTLKENLLYGINRNVSEDEIREVLHQAQCSFVDNLKSGLSHPITDQGQGLSTGQKQRLCLARALLRKPKALILDEATANLDEETEASLIRILEQFKGRMTIIAATHRKGFLALADEVIELRKEEKVRMFSRKLA